jgi:DNA-binding MarR family transcriptional regulator
MPVSTKVVTDLDTLRAVAHPLRMSLLGALRMHGPATASELARRLGESSGATSYHLRQLARFGFVGDDDSPARGRERRWKALHQRTSLPDDLWTGEQGRTAWDVVRERQQAHLLAGLAAWTEPQPGLGHDDHLLHLDPADAIRLREQILELVDSYADREGSLAIALHVLALPGQP